MVNTEPTHDDLTELWEIAVRYVKDNRVTCEEHIPQCDDAQISAIDFAIDAAGIVGYVDLDDL